MSRFVLHPEAKSDLSDIWEYIASDSFDAASDLTSRPLRFQAVREYVIA